MVKKAKILFLCTGNSCRNQTAEGWTRHLKKHQLEPYSAGVKPKGRDPRAVKALAEVGIDVSEQRSKDIDALGDLEFDDVITLCDNARESPAPFSQPKPGWCITVSMIHPSWQPPQGMRKRS